MSNGFGFSFNNDDDDPDRDREGENNFNPFGIFGFSTGGTGQGGQDGHPGQGLGDILSQFGQMLSGMGTSMNSAEGSGPVNYDVAGRIARQQIGNVPAIRQQDTNAVVESVRLAELWLDDSTSLPAANSNSQAWNSTDWLDATFPMWKRLITPVAQHMNEAQLDSLPDQAREMLGPMTSMLAQMSAMNFGMQLGHALGDLAKQALTGSDFSLPVAPANTIGVLPENAQKVARDLDLPSQEVLVYIAAREAARQRLFRHVPWLIERIVSSVEEYAAGLVIDTSHIEEATREINLESGDPAAIQDALARLQGMDLSPRISSRNDLAVSRLETLLALVEGWAEFVVTEALGERLPSAAQLTEAFRRRRATGGNAETAFSKVVGIELAAPKVSDAVELWRRATVAVGVERRDATWDHPDFLPTAEHLEAPADFIDGLLDDTGDDNFDEEFAKLEEMLRQQSDDSSDADGSSGEESDDEK